MVEFCVGPEKYVSDVEIQKRLSKRNAIKSWYLLLTREGSTKAHEKKLLKRQ